MRSGSERRALAAVYVATVLAAIVTAPLAAQDDRAGMVAAEALGPRGRSLRVRLDSAEIRVQVHSRATTVTVVTPSGTFVSAWPTDLAIGLWADAALSLPAPTAGPPDAQQRPTTRYSAIELLEPDESAPPDPLRNTALFLVRLDADERTRYALTCTNQAWTCELVLSPDQARTLFAALRGDSASGAEVVEYARLGSTRALDRPSADGDWLEGHVDRPVSVRSRPNSLKYPKELAGSGIGGSVRLMFIVEANGQVRASSIRLLGQSDPVLARAARTALFTMRFRAAVRDGNAVPMSVIQDFVFARP